MRHLDCQFYWLVEPYLSTLHAAASNLDGAMQQGTEDRLEQVLTILKEQVVHRPQNTLRTLSSTLIYFIAYSLSRLR
jgi:hypothetical protein